MGRLLVGRSLESHWRTEQARMGRYRRRYQDVTRAALAAAYEEAARVYAATGSVSRAAAAAQRINAVRFEEPYLQVSEGVMLASGQRLAQAWDRARRTRSYPGVVRTAWRKDTEGNLRRRIMEWLAVHSSHKVTRVAETTKEQVRRSLLAAEAAGLSLQDTAAQLQRIGPISARQRAIMVARTETLGATQAGELAGLRATRADAGKRWLDAQDNRVRGAPGGEYEAARFDHSRVNADNGVIAVDQRFMVNGEELDHPGDPAGAAANIINCRCVLAYELPD